MSKKSIYLLGILATILIGCFLYHKLCCSSCDNGCHNKSTSPMPDKSSGTAFSASSFSLQGNGVDFTSQSNFSFLKNDLKAILPIADSIDLGISDLKTVFDKGGSFLIITGYATKDETNNSDFPNLGLARANQVKDYFISKGILPTQMEIRGIIKEDLSSRMDTLFGPVSFGIIEKLEVVKGDEWTELKEKINANPLVLYFKTGKTQNDLSAEDRQKVADMKKYLDHVESAKLDVVGHTDDVGSRDTNIRLGQQRADFAKQYLVKNGISVEKINSTSKGPDEPLMDNTTPEGRAKNRRTVVKIN
jgi:OOP family OmpA-OmpF porin